MSDRQLKAITIGRAIWALRQQIEEVHCWLPLEYDGDYTDLCAARLELDLLIQRIEVQQLAEAAA